MLETIDEGKLSPIERMGLAYCRLNCWIWDELAGDKPDGFEQMTNEEKHGYIEPQLDRIEQILGSPYTSRCWWVYELGKTEEEWLEWRKSRMPDERESNRENNAQRAEENGKHLQNQIAPVLAFCIGFALGLLLLFVLKAFHGGFAA